MEVNEFLSEKRITFNLKADDKEGIIREIAELFVEDGIVTKENYELLVSDLLAREALSSTGMQEGIAIPHTKTEATDKISMAVAVCKEGKEFSALDDQKTTLFFMIIAPDNTKKEHLDILSLISKLSFEDELKKELLETNDAKRVIEILESLR